MFKTISTIIITAVAVIFSMQNFEHVPVYIFWGKSINIRLIFVIAISFVTGYLIRHFIGISREERLKREIHNMLKTKRASIRKKRNNEFEEYEI